MAKWTYVKMNGKRTRTYDRFTVRLSKQFNTNELIFIIFFGNLFVEIYVHSSPCAHVCLCLNGEYRKKCIRKNIIDFIKINHKPFVAVLFPSFESSGERTANVYNLLHCFYDLIVMHEDSKKKICFSCFHYFVKTF